MCGHGARSSRPTGWRVPTTTPCALGSRRSSPTQSTTVWWRSRRAHGAPRHRPASRGPTFAPTSRCGRCTMSCPSDCGRRCCWERSLGWVMPRAAGQRHRLHARRPQPGLATPSATSEDRRLARGATDPAEPRAGAVGARRAVVGRRVRGRQRNGVTSSRRGRCSGRSAQHGRRWLACRRTSASTTYATTSPACSSPAVPT